MWGTPLAARLRAHGTGSQPQRPPPLQQAPSHTRTHPHADMCLPLTSPACTAPAPGRWPRELSRAPRNQTATATAPWSCPRARRRRCMAGRMWVGGGRRGARVGRSECMRRQQPLACSQVAAAGRSRGRGRRCSCVHARRAMGSAERTAHLERTVCAPGRPATLAARCGTGGPRDAGRTAQAPLQGGWAGAAGGVLAAGCVPRRSVPRAAIPGSTVADHRFAAGMPRCAARRIPHQPPQLTRRSAGRRVTRMYCVLGA